MPRRIEFEYRIPARELKIVCSGDECGHAGVPCPQYVPAETGDNALHIPKCRAFGISLAETMRRDAKRCAACIEAEKATTDEARTDQSHKADAGKLRYDLIPLRAEEMLAAVLTHGAERYGANSWRSVPNARVRYFAALRRHIAQWALGNHTDADSGLPHLAHALCNVVFLLELDLEKPSDTD